MEFFPYCIRVCGGGVLVSRYHVLTLNDCQQQNNFKVNFKNFLVDIFLYILIEIIMFLCGRVSIVLVIFRGLGKGFVSLLKVHHVLFEELFWSYELKYLKVFSSRYMRFFYQDLKDFILFARKSHYIFAILANWENETFWLKRNLDINVLLTIAWLYLIR